jgi:5'-nucleotidase
MISPEEFPMPRAAEVVPALTYDRAYPRPSSVWPDDDKQILEEAAANRDATVTVDGKPTEPKSWIQTFSKQALNPRAIDPASCRIEDIAHALACEGRFTNQTPEPYSVAQHCVIGSRLIAPQFALAFLLHELDEVYLPDLAKPLKGHVWVEREGDGHCSQCGLPSLRPWVNMGAEHEIALLQVLKLESLLPLIHSPEVKAMDWAMLAWEKRDLMTDPPRDWGLTVPPPALAETTILAPWLWHSAKEAFKQRFALLTDLSVGNAVEP